MTRLRRSDCSGPEISRRGRGRGFECRDEHGRRSPTRRCWFDYPAKSGIRRVQAVVDPVAAAIVAALRRRRGGGEELVAYREVAHYLGNTPAVCRASYIDPPVFDAYRAGLVIGRPLRQEVHAPYEAARARALLAEAYHAEGDEEAAELELRAAESTFVRLGALPDARRAAQLGAL